MAPKSSAHYQRKYRERLREQGLVKKEVWIRPEHATQLSELEALLRKEAAPPITTGAMVMNNNTKRWTTSELHEALLGTDLVRGGAAVVELIDGVEPALYITLNDYGDLPVFLTVAGEQIIVESLLWSIEEVADTAAFNEAVLRTHKYFPLSTVSLDKSGNHGDYYHMFGALSASSKLENVVLEVEVLASNVIQATEAYAEFLAHSVAAI